MLTADISKRNTSVTNREFAKANRKFRTACEHAGVEPSRRQAGKWRRKHGAAWNYYSIKVASKAVKQLKTRLSSSKTKAKA